jgi:UDPglucose 6-dehydrogenase
LGEGATITVFDPEAMENVRQQLDSLVEYADNQYDCLNNADALIIATEWNEFRTPDFELIEQRLKSKVIFDGRNLFENSMMQNLDFHYESIGRKAVSVKTQVS